MKRLLLFALCLPADIVAWSIVLFCRLFWGSNLRWRAPGALTMNFLPDSWPMRTWYKSWGGTTFGHGMILYPDPIEKTLKHEFVHVKQFEGSCLVAALTALLLLITGAGWLTIAPVLTLHWFARVLTANAAAWLRGESFYRGSIEEEAAYALQDKP